VRERCVLGRNRDTGKSYEIKPEDLYGAYRSWCEDNEHIKASKHVFGRDLAAAVPAIRKERRGKGRDRHYVYVGIALRAVAAAGAADEDEDDDGQYGLI
jgi:phage/plasmid-associated DNA primase